MPIQAPILYTFRRCPYAMRARLALYAKKISYEHREVNLKNKPSQLIEISSKGTVPVLQLQDGTVLEESLDIMKWVYKIILPSADEELISINDTTFKYALDRYKYPGRYLEDTTNYRDECETFINTIENRLSPFLHGNMPSFVDIAIFPFIRQFAMVDSEWFNTSSYQRTKAWLCYFTESTLFEQVMQKYPFWVPDLEPLLICLDKS